ncbi:MAG: glycoside hydrolase family 127 protein [Phycisphaerales bacterium]|nr:glycoside hydrolase family 127 protein [Phycisphaerales bacterium]
MPRLHRSSLAVPVVFVLAAASLNTQEISVVKEIPAATNRHYVSNRPPLLPTPLIKLPVGTVRPGGWLKRQLELQAAGFIGHLGEISKWLVRDGNAWLSPAGEGHSNWEELPYWLKGFGDMAYLLGDEKLIAEAKVWIEGAFASQREDGYFGPRENLKVIKTDRGDKPDLWPNMVMLNALQSYHEFTGDPRVPDLMRRYFRWQLEYPESDFLLPYWQQQRAADNLASVYWLYNRTGEAWLLELGEKIQRRTANWTDGVPNWHGVNIAQSFRGPAVYYQQSKNEKYRHAPYASYEQVMNLYGQVPGGMFGADENCRRGMDDPRQAAESCTMVEFMYSFEQLLSITGDLTWADRCEDVAFNSLPVAMTADFRGIRYLSAPNMISSDHRSKAPGYENGGPMQCYDPRDQRCCQHNVAHGWPYFAEHLFMATGDNGLAAMLLAPGEVKAKVGDGGEVTIRSETRYPFEDTITFHVSTKSPTRFPFYVRIPGWCDRPTVSINDGEAKHYPESQRQLVKLDRQWRDGDRVTLRLPMRASVKSWPKNKDSVSIDYGPLTMSLKIAEEYRNIRPDDKWPAFDVFAKSAWNYGVAPNEDGSFTLGINRSKWPADDQPFAVDAAPIQITVKGRRIPDWQEDYLGLVGRLQPSPAKTSEPIENLTLIPMGAARLRISQFPLVSNAPNAHEWTPPARPKEGFPTTASHYWQESTLSAASDGLEPESSDDYNVPRFTWWPQKGTTEWIQYDFTAPRKITGVSVYWFDDTGRGNCRVPESWRLLYRVGDEWRPVSLRGVYGIAKDTYNAVAIDTVETMGLRIEAKLRPEFSAGILEWRVE